MIDAGTTVVVFMDNSADFASVPYLIDEFSNMWEDPYGESVDQCWTNGRRDDDGMELRSQ